MSIAFQAMVMTERQKKFRALNEIKNIQPSLCLTCCDGFFKKLHDISLLSKLKDAARLQFEIFSYKKRKALMMLS